MSVDREIFRGETLEDQLDFDDSKLKSDVRGRQVLEKVQIGALQDIIYRLEDEYFPIETEVLKNTLPQWNLEDIYIKTKGTKPALQPDGEIEFKADEKDISLMATNIPREIVLTEAYNMAHAMLSLVDPTVNPVSQPLVPLNIQTRRHKALQSLIEMNLEITMDPGTLCLLLDAFPEGFEGISPESLQLVLSSKLWKQYPASHDARINLGDIPHFLRANFPPEMMQILLDMEYDHLKESLKRPEKEASAQPWILDRYGRSPSYKTYQAFVERYHQTHGVHIEIITDIFRYVFHSIHSNSNALRSVSEKIPFIKEMSLFIEDAGKNKFGRQLGENWNCVPEPIEKYIKALMEWYGQWYEKITNEYSENVDLDTLKWPSNEWWQEKGLIPPHLPEAWKTDDSQE